jgi:hypothetical protein
MIKALVAAFHQQSVTSSAKNSLLIGYLHGACSFLNAPTAGMNNHAADRTAMCNDRKALHFFCPFTLCFKAL